jgi:aldehyde dehydrogenase (NAD+)
MSTVDNSFDPATVQPKGTHFIHGIAVGGGETITVYRPSDNTPYSEIPDAGANIVDQAVESAKRALKESGWSKCAPRDRAKVLRRWAELVEANVIPLGQLEAVSSTRPVNEAIGWDVPTTAECIRFYSEFTDKHGGDIAATQSDQLGMVIAEPIGIVGAIAPWNFPLVMATWKIAPALAAGNAVVLKPSEMTPFSIVRLAELAIEAGLPAGLFNVVTGLGHTTGDALVRHPDIGKVTFTGSTRTGSNIMAACANTGPKPVTLELGGKSPQVVFGDIDNIDTVAATVSRAILGNSGQVCVAGSRLLVQSNIADQVLEKITANAKTVNPGPTWQASSTFSPIISQKQAQDISRRVDDAIQAGASAHIGGEFFGDPESGAFYQPTLLTNVNSGMAAVQEEIFGPVLTVQTFETEEEAYALANDSCYGLAAGVFTSNINRGLRAVRNIQAGTIWMNRYGRSGDFIIPTGGYKQSGIGKDLGKQAYEANLKFKSVLIGIEEA